jgi:hypothetical protein
MASWGWGWAMIQKASKVDGKTRDVKLSELDSSVRFV